MGRAPCCDKANVKKGPWSPEEDAKLKEYIEKHGTGGNWIALPQKAGLKRCGKSCRLRWLNYLRPNIKHGEFSEDEERIICCLFASIGSRWSIIASQLPGRTDNDIKNYWNTKLKKKMMGMDPQVLEKPHQVALLSILQSSTLSSSSSPPPPLSFSNNNSSYYHPHQVSFTSHDESISYSSSLFMSGYSSNSVDSTFQSQEGTFVDNNAIQNYQVKDGVLMFVKESELGSCGDYGVLGDGTFDHIGGHNYPYNGVEDTQKLMFSNASRGSEWLEEQSSNMLGEYPLDCGLGLEEIKKLISTSSCNNFLFDENKTGKGSCIFEG